MQPATAPTPDPTPAPAPPAHRIDLRYTRPPLSANERLHHHAHARLTAEVRERVGWLVRSARVPRYPRITVGLEWRPAVVRRRDGAENVCPTLKPVIDGIVDAGVVPDDTPDLVVRLMPVLLPVRGPREAGMWLLVTGDAPYPTAI